jgi:hypothetical protein
MLAHLLYVFLMAAAGPYDPAQLPTANEFAARCRQDVDWCMGRIIEITEIDCCDCPNRQVPENPPLRETILDYIAKHPRLGSHPYTEVAREAMNSKWPCNPPSH